MSPQIFAVSAAGHRTPPYPGNPTIKLKLPPGTYLDWMDGRPIVGPFGCEEDAYEHYRHLAGGAA